MRRILRIAGYAALAIAGLIISAVTEFWPLVWFGGFPLAYIGALGVCKEWTAGRPSKETTDL